jgi:uncharacterized protein
MKRERIFAYISVLIASDFLLIFSRSFFNLSSIMTASVHALFVLFMMIISAIYFKRLLKLNLMLLAVNVTYVLTAFLYGSEPFKQWFDQSVFVGQFGGSILLKMIAAGLIALLLITVFGSFEKSYLMMGNLKVKADRMGWLGIDHQKISWGKLAVISAVLISLGTFLGTVVTVTGFTFVRNIDGLLSLLPFVLIFALGNSLFEGILYRNTIIASLTSVLDKNDVVILGAIFFGVAHYFGAPGGPLGVAMSGVLGWYLCRSMIETKGLFTSWLIHFLQDVVIFSAVILLGGFGI